MSMKRLLRIFLLVNLAIFVSAFLLVVVYLYSTLNDLHLLDCAFLRVFGFGCPGCGTTRAILSLFRLQIFRALCYSPGICTAVLVLLYFDVVAFVSLIQRRPQNIRYFKIWSMIFIPIVFIVTFVIRTILHFSLGIDFV